MHSIPWLQRCLVAAMLLASMAPASCAARPNIVVILIDDLGWADFGCFGGTLAKTPHIDRLAAEGRRFEQFYVASPICSPSRVALATGQYPQRWRITSYLDWRTNNQARGLAQWLDPAAPMLPRALRAAGYAVGHFGKWHMGGQRDVGDAPPLTEYGFEETLTNFEGLGPRLLGLGEFADGRPPRRQSLNSEKLGHGPVIWQDRSQLTATYAGAALAFLRRAVAAGKPCYVNLWPDDVHSPFFPPAGRRGDEAKRTLYRAVLETMDAQLGVFFDALRADAGLRDNTIVFLCSDNGPERGAGSAGPLRGGKGMLYEGGIRSPLIVWSPALLDRAHTNTVDRTSVLSSLDLAPTVLALAGAAPATELDGLALPDVFLGRAPASRRRPLFFSRPPDRKDFEGMRNLPDLAVRDGRWKLLCNRDGARAELYDLEADPGEKNNLASTQSDVTARLTAAVRTWHTALPASRANLSSNEIP